jgi:hypothetical protein
MIHAFQKKAGVLPLARQTCSDWPEKNVGQASTQLDGRNDAQ